jgi:polyisoprenoid-binding protein YceI
MKKFFVFALVLTVFAACNSGSTAEKAEVGEAQDEAAMKGATYTADTEASVINWTGRKLGDDEHNGTLSLSEGMLSVEGDNITGGSFTIDMASMACTDEMDEGKKAYLVKHLSSGDFFHVEKYPTAKFTITSVEALEGDSTATHAISGNLMMLDSTHNVTFNAMVANESGTITATSQGFVIDRTMWNIKFMSTLLGMAKNKAIKNDLELKVTLVASEGEATVTEEEGEKETE